MIVLQSVFIIVVMAFAISAISMTLTKSGVFHKLRENIDAKSKFFGDLFNCPYCMSHWVSGFLSLFIAHRVPITGSWLLNYILLTFSVVALASAVNRIIYTSTALVMELYGIDAYEEEHE